MKELKLAIAVSLPLLLAAGAWLVLRPAPGDTGPVLGSPDVPATGTSRGFPHYTKPVPVEDWERVDPPRGNVATVPGTRPVPPVDEAEVLSVDLAKALLAEGTNEAWMRLRELLKTGRREDPRGVQALIIAALGKGKNDSVHAVQALVLFQDEALRQRAAEDLMTLAHATLDGQVLKAAFEAIGQLGDGTVVDGLADFVRRLTDKGTVVQALNAIAEIGAPESANALARLLAEQQGAPFESEIVLVIGRLKSGAMVEALKPLLTPDNPPELRLDALRGMALAGAPEALGPLKGILDGNESRALKDAALDGLGRIATPESVTELLRIRREGGDLAFNAGLALGNARGDAAAEVILREIDGEKDERIRVRMIQALEGASLDVTQERLVGFLDSPDESSIIRQYSARTLGSSGDPRAVAPLTKALAGAEPTDRGLRTSILRGLLNLATLPGAADDLREQTLPVLDAMLKEQLDDQDRFWIQRIHSVIKQR